MKNGENNPRWKGDKAGYQSKHQYLVRNFGNPVACNECGKKATYGRDGRCLIHWALKNGYRYTHDINNYVPLCQSCHSKYDITDKMRKQLKEMTRKSNIGDKTERNQKRSKIALVRPRDAKGHFIKQQ